jgi:methyltransferase (TIGR00027 family)
MRHDVSVATEPSEPLGGVSDTALGAAEMRAEETLRSDRLIEDPYAAAFVAAAPPLFPDVPAFADDADLAALVEAGITGVAVRTRFFDDYLEEACAAGCQQVVLLAAGLDTRAFRLDWPHGVQLFELDLPELFAFKEPVLEQEGAQPRCERRVVPVDLRDDWARSLTMSGFEPARMSAWVAEGLLVYLSRDDAASLLTTVGDLSARESRLSFDHDVPDQDSALRQAKEMDGMAEVAAMWHGGLTEHPAQWLTDHGWNADSIARDALVRGYGRELPNPTGAFVTGLRR